MDPKTQKYAKYNKSLTNTFILGGFSWRFLDADLKIETNKIDLKPNKLNTTKKYSHLKPMAK